MTKIKNKKKTILENHVQKLLTWRFVFIVSLPSQDN